MINRYVLRGLLDARRGRRVAPSDRSHDRQSAPLWPSGARGAPVPRDLDDVTRATDAAAWNVERAECPGAKRDKGRGGGKWFPSRGPRIVSVDGVPPRTPSGLAALPALYTSEKAWAASGSKRRVAPPLGLLREADARRTAQYAGPRCVFVRSRLAPTLVVPRWAQFERWPAPGKPNAVAPVGPLEPEHAAPRVNRAARPPCPAWQRV